MKKGKFIWGPANDLERSQSYIPIVSHTAHEKQTFSQPSASTWADPPSFQVFFAGPLWHWSFPGWLYSLVLILQCTHASSSSPMQCPASFWCVSNLNPLDELIWVFKVVSVFKPLATEEWVAKPYEVRSVEDMWGSSNGLWGNRPKDKWRWPFSCNFISPRTPWKEHSSDPSTAQTTLFCILTALRHLKTGHGRYSDEGDVAVTLRNQQSHEGRHVCGPSAKGHLSKNKGDGSSEVRITDSGVDENLHEGAGSQAGSCRMKRSCGPEGKSIRACLCVYPYHDS